MELLEVAGTPMCAKQRLGARKRAIVALVGRLRQIRGPTRNLTSSASFNSSVTWEGADDGSGIHGYRVLQEHHTSYYRMRKAAAVVRMTARIRA
jgi:hypothetical protein